jgi:hypothetical protein
MRERAMTLMQSPISFKRRLPGEEDGGQAHAAIASEADMSHPGLAANLAAPGLAPVGRAAPNLAVSQFPEADAPESTTSVALADPTPLRLYGFAALSGAVAASVVALVVSVFPLHINDDPRTLQLIHDVGDVTTRVDTLTAKTRTVETEDVAASQTLSTIDKRLASTQGELNAVQTALGALTDEQTRSRDAMAGVNAPALFGVAAVQLRDRIEAGEPFDWEVVNLRGLVGTDPALRGELDRLASISTTGVATQQQLTTGMQALISQTGGGSLMEAGIGVVSRVLGPNLVTQVGTDPQVLSQAMARLEAADLANFLRSMQGLSAPTAAAARPVVLAAQRRLVALSATQTLLRAARTGLQAQLRAATTTVVARPGL